MSPAAYSIAIVHQTRLTRYFHSLGFSDIIHMRTSASLAGAPAWSRRGATSTAQDLRARFGHLGYRFRLVPALAA